MKLLIKYNIKKKLNKWKFVYRILINLNDYPTISAIIILLLNNN